MLATLALLALSEPAVAQSVTGRVLEQGAGTPVNAVVVELLRPDSTRIRRTLSGRDGRFSLTLDRPGTYRIRLDRLGYRTMIVGPFVLRGDTTLQLRVVPAPFDLAPIEATRNGRCAVRPETGEATATLWEQIRKVLSVATVVSEERLLEFELLRFARDLDADRSALELETLTAWRGSDPFEPRSGEELARDGFVQPADERSMYWFMPDADVIMSDAFLETHCFSVAERTEAGRRQLGLAFEPLDDDRDEPERVIRNPDFDELIRDDPADVEGVLWVDAETAALETLEYGYTGIRSDEMRALAGGYARFEQLADGKWVVRQWWISMPRFLIRTSRLGPSRDHIPAGVRETGGELLHARDGAGQTVTHRAGVRLSGRVVTSDVGIPFDASTIVRLSGTSLVTRPGPDGSFVLPGVAPGRYLAMFQHPRLDTLGIDLPVQPVQVDREPVDITLSMPDRGAVLDAVCPDMDHDSLAGVLLVALVDENGEALNRERVRLRTILDDRDLGTYRTSTDGFVRFCDVPSYLPLEIVLPDSDDLRVWTYVPARDFRRDDVRVAG